MKNFFEMLFILRFSTFF